LNVEKYDKLLWRVNGTIFLILCVFSVLGGIAIGVKLILDFSRPTTVHDVVEVDKVTKKKDFLKLGFFQELNGTRYLLVPLNSDNEIRTHSYSKNSYQNIRNYLLFDKESKQEHWLWENNKNLVTNDYKVHTRLDNENIVSGLFFEVVSKDTNQDKLMTYEDQKDFIYVNLKNLEKTNVENNIERVIGFNQTSSDEAMIFFSKSGKSFYKSIDLATGELSKASELRFDNKK